MTKFYCVLCCCFDVVRLHVLYLSTFYSSIIIFWWTFLLSALIFCFNNVIGWKEELDFLDKRQLCLYWAVKYFHFWLLVAFFGGNETFFSFSRIKMTKVTAFFCLLCIVMLFAETSTFAWRRRRRRRRRRTITCQLSDCTVSSWSSWSSCSYPCGTGGTQSRSRYVTTRQACGGRPCPSLYESRACNRNPNLCRNYGTPHSTGCFCKAGFTGTCCSYGKFYNHLTRRSRKSQK